MIRVQHHCPLLMDSLHSSGTDPVGICDCIDFSLCVVCSLHLEKSVSESKEQ